MDNHTKAADEVLKRLLGSVTGPKEDVSDQDEYEALMHAAAAESVRRGTDAASSWVGFIGQHLTHINRCPNPVLRRIQLEAYEAIFAAVSDVFARLLEIIAEDKERCK